MDDIKVQTLIMKGLITELPQIMQDDIKARFEKLKSEYKPNDSYIDFMAIVLLLAEMDLEKIALEPQFSDEELDRYADVMMGDKEETH